MKVQITEANDLRDALFARLLKADERDYSEYAAQHDVYPCVRKGAGERWLRDRGETFKPSKSAALYFLRGKSAEAILSRDATPQEMIVRNGVACHPDLSKDDLDALFADLMKGYPGVNFAEIKSTNFSSWAWFKYVEQGGVDLAVEKAFKMRNYVEQSANYAVALGVDRCLLIVFFLHGDYGERRKSCPRCGNIFGPIIDDFYKECVGCGYKSKKLDLWVYELRYDAESLRMVDADVFTLRPAQFRRAVKAKDEAGVMKAAPPTPCFYCRSCQVGKRIGCENAGKEFD